MVYEGFMWFMGSVCVIYGWFMDGLWMVYVVISVVYGWFVYGF